MNRILPFVLLLLATHCLANDSIGYLGAGGIEFKKSEDISMEKEILTVSRNLIRVEYEFLNTTSKPIKETIFFPMPFYGFDFGCSPEHSGKLEEFKVWADGVKLSPSRTVRARLKGKDVTFRLHELGFTDEDIAEYRGIEGNCGSDDTPPPTGIFAKKIDALVKDGLAENIVNNDRTQFRTVFARALWETAYFYSWEQEFPPLKRVKVVHEYIPFRGGGVWWYDFRKAEAFKTQWAADVKKFCITDGTIGAGNKIQIENNVEAFPWNSVQYVLTTGANWAGPIKDFTLNLKKRSKNEIVSLCFDDGQFKKTDDLTITSHINGFVPTKDVTAIFFFDPSELREQKSSDEGAWMPDYRRTKK
ncbi:hypothetical protein GALL_238810 [mine drainage metagenome]|uniref:DUF4424 domain-containing protein n=1 Tax=mine drainage metagenome TaxID=410659 RepID=A0A1J5RDH6_9ZZZZ